MLTGHTRYRAKCRLFRKPIMVLQVEERVYVRGLHPLDYDDCVNQWRDARVEDLAELPVKLPMKGDMQ